MRSPGQPIRIELEVEPGALPLSGRMSGADGVQRSFVGWTGLAAELTVLLECAERHDERPRSS